MTHTVVKTDEGFTCTVCQWSWKTKPRSACPGVIQYRWQQAPENLKTIGQLKKMNLKPGPRRGLVGEFNLYDVNEAIPFTPEEIAVERERVRKLRLRKCQHCGREVDRSRWTEDYDACNKCLPAAREQRAEEERQRREYLAREEREQRIRDHDDPILWARELLNRSDWVIVDCETTGLQAYADEVISVAIMAPDGSELLNTLIKPLKAIPPEATAINGITNEMVEHTPSFAEVFPKILEQLKDRRVIAYNESFDRWMLRGACRQNQIDEDLVPEPKRWECAMLKYASYYGEWSEYHGSYTWQPLPSGNHQAGGDCLAVLELIKEMAAAKLSTYEEI
jgi:DNA polymerase-3 subunit epsilon